MKNWIKIIGVLSVVLMSQSLGAQSQANAIDKYFKQYLDDERFTVVYLSPKLFEILGRFKVDDLKMDDKEADAFLEVAKQTKGLRILSTDVNPRQFFEEAKSKINTSEYEVLMTVRDNKDKEDVEFLVIEEGNTIKELFLLVGGSDSFVMMSFVGDLSLKNISNLANSMEDGN